MGNRKTPEGGWLVIRRYPGEFVLVGDVIVSVAEIRRDGTVALAIRAPKHIKITRPEMKKKPEEST